MIVYNLIEFEVTLLSPHNIEFRMYVHQETFKGHNVTYMSWPLWSWGKWHEEAALLVWSIFAREAHHVICFQIGCTSNDQNINH